MNLIFCKQKKRKNKQVLFQLENLKIHGFNFLQASQGSKNIN